LVKKQTLYEDYLLSSVVTRITVPKVPVTIAILIGTVTTKAVISTRNLMPSYSASGVLDQGMLLSGCVNLRFTLRFYLQFRARAWKTKVFC
jgi:hypothetical protein